MSTVLKKSSNKISEEDYLAGEMVSEIKHEYVGGQVYAMTGGTKNHSRISGNFYRKIQDFLAGKTGEAFNDELKVKVPEGNYRYPDVTVICDDDPDNDLYSERPVILVEVLSSSTRRTDETTKKFEYLSIPTLKEYVLIEQDFVDVEVFRKENSWCSDHYFIGDEVHFDSIGFTISVKEIYERVQNKDTMEFLRAKEGENGQ